MSVYRCISAAVRPAWSEVGSAGRFRIEPNSDRESEYVDDAWVMGRFDPHYHYTDEYWLICEGRGILRVEDEEYAFGPGDILCIEREKVHDVVGAFGPIEGFYLTPTRPPDESKAHVHRSADDARGHVVPLLSEAHPERG